MALACGYCGKLMPPDADFGKTWTAHGEVVCCGDAECRAAEDQHYAEHWPAKEPKA